MDEGYIKFQADWQQTAPFAPASWKALAFWRQRLYAHHWIGVYPDGIGFGNISYRERVGQVCPFIITGSKTGAHPLLTEQDFSRVVDWSASHNTVRCEGPIVASSESMSHAAIYEQLPGAQVVMHIHSADLWSRYLHRLPTTPESVTYGTPEMVVAVQELLKTHGNPAAGVIVMAGHEEGLFAYGENYQAAYQELVVL